MEEQNAVRYVLGKREEDGRYPVTVDDSPAGTVHRRHGSWYATVPGHRNDRRFNDRFQAAEFLVTLADTGIRPTVPTPGSTHTPARSVLSPLVGRHADLTYRHLIPDLRLTVSNLVKASEAMARLAQLGWTPLEGYPGADQPWLMACRLCGWKGRRFWSHLRGRNGDKTPRPANRHPHCIPTKEFPSKLATLAAERTRECPCEFKHPMEIREAMSTLSLIRCCISNGDTAATTMHARAILEPCPASTRRAIVLRMAEEHWAAALRATRP
ncbi:hypothetical protein ACFVFF_38755 [Streptomyces sp. NPDC057680]|uniref:hypothetical protein n=1 Tax=Streptomyces sp. NPDC057680 TaxID=3346208 RepID=UPI00368E15D1